MRSESVEDLTHYTACRAAGPITVDGKLDEPSWAMAPLSSAFVDIVTGEPGWFDTRVAVLWDADNLYFGFRAEEPDVWTTLADRDSKICEDNDMEVFIAGNDAYYEFEINALNTIYEVFWVLKDQMRPGGKFHGKQEWDPVQHKMMEIDGIGGHIHPRGWRFGYLDWDYPGLKHAVHVDGTLNNRDDVDKGWTVELAFPWKELEVLADGRSLPPNGGDVLRIDCSRFQQVNEEGERLEVGPGWTWNKHGYYDSHILEVFTYVHFSHKVVEEGLK